MLRNFKPKRCACGSKYTPTSGAQQRCPKCRAKAKARLAPDPRDCQECSEEFQPKNGNEKYCKRCRAKRKAMGSAAYKLKSAADEVSPARAGAAPGDFSPPTSPCSRCANVVRLSRTEEYFVIVREGGRHDNPADRLILCRSCHRERALKAFQPESPDAIFDARQAASARCLTILLSLDRADRAAAWSTLTRAVRAMR